MEKTTAKTYTLSNEKLFAPKRFYLEAKVLPKQYTNTPLLYELRHISKAAANLLAAALCISM